MINGDEINNGMHAMDWEANGYVTASADDICSVRDNLCLHPHLHYTTLGAPLSHNTTKIINT